jgi:hypothetical protein
MLSPSTSTASCAVTRTEALAPKAGYDTGSNSGTGLAALIQRKPSFSRTATRSILSGSPTCSATAAPSHRLGLTKGAIAGIVIGILAIVILNAILWFLCSKRILRRREEQRKSQMTLATAYTGTTAHAGVQDYGSPQSQVYSPANKSETFSHFTSGELPSGNEQPYMYRDEYDHRGSYPPAEVSAAPMPVEVQGDVPRASQAPLVSPSSIVSPSSLVSPVPLVSPSDSPNPETQNPLSPTVLANPNITSMDEYNWATYHAPHQS